MTYADVELFLQCLLVSGFAMYQFNAFRKLEARRKARHETAMARLEQESERRTQQRINELEIQEHNKRNQR